MLKVVVAVTSPRLLSYWSRPWAVCACDPPAAIVALMAYAPLSVEVHTPLLPLQLTPALADQLGVIATGLPYRSAPAAAKVCEPPAAIEAGLGVTVIEYSAAALTLSVALPLTAPL